MKNPTTAIPPNEAEKSLLVKLQANEGFKLLLTCIRAEMTERMIAGAYIRVDTPTANGLQEAEACFKQAERLKDALETIENTVQKPTIKEIKYVS